MVIKRLGSGSRPLILPIEIDAGIRLRSRSAGFQGPFQAIIHRHPAVAPTAKSLLFGGQIEKPPMNDSSPACVKEFHFSRSVVVNFLTRYILFD